MIQDTRDWVLVGDGDIYFSVNKKGKRKMAVGNICVSIKFKAYDVTCLCSGETTLQ